MLIEYVFNPSADGSVIKQQSIKLSCIFIMYFLSFFHFPNQKFISASSLSVWLRPRGGGEGFEVLLSLAGQRKRAPRLRDPPKPHPPPPSRAGGWWEGGASILGADFLFTFSWGHSAGWPCPSVSLQHFNSSFNWNLRQTAQNPPAADPSTFHISNISDVRFKVWVHQDVTRQSVDFIIVARADGAEEEVLFGSDWEPDDSSVSQRPAACPAVQPVLLQTEPSFTTWTSRCVVEYTHWFLLIFTSSVDAMKRPRVLWPKQRFMLFFHQIRRPGSARFDPVHQPSAAGNYFSITTVTRVGLYLMTCFSGVRRAAVLLILIR